MQKCIMYRYAEQIAAILVIIAAIYFLLKSLVG